LPITGWRIACRKIWIGRRQLNTSFRFAAVSLRWLWRSQRKASTQSRKAKTSGARKLQWASPPPIAGPVTSPTQLTSTTLDMLRPRSASLLRSIIAAWAMGPVPAISPDSNLPASRKSSSRVSTAIHIST